MSLGLVDHETRAHARHLSGKRQRIVSGDHSSLGRYRSYQRMSDWGSMDECTLTCHAKLEASLADEP